MTLGIVLAVVAAITGISAWIVRLVRKPAPRVIVPSIKPKIEERQTKIEQDKAKTDAAIEHEKRATEERLANPPNTDADAQAELDWLKASRERIEAERGKS